MEKLFSINKLFSKCVIVVCLAYMIRVTERTLNIAEFQGNNCYNILAAAGVVFGGELLLLAFKDVVAEKVKGTINKMKSQEERDC